MNSWSSLSLYPLSILTTPSSPLFLLPSITTPSSQLCHSLLLLSPHHHHHSHHHALSLHPKLFPHHPPTRLLPSLASRRAPPFEDDHPLPLLSVYILKRLLAPLILGTLAFTLLGLSIGAGPEVIMPVVEKLGVSWQSVIFSVRLISLHIPLYIGLALPMASLLASLLAFGRMGADNEITVLRACGVSTWRIITPALCIFVGVTAMHFIVSEGFAPRANRTASAIVRDQIYTSASYQQLSGRQESRRPYDSSGKIVIFPQFGENGLQLLYYGLTVGNQRLQNTTLLEVQARGCGECFPGKDLAKSNGGSPVGIRLKRVLAAKSAYWDKTQRTWILEDGIEYVVEESVSTISMHSNKRVSQSRSQSRSFQTAEFQGLSPALLDIVELDHDRSFEGMEIAEALKLLELHNLSRNLNENRRLKVKLYQRMALPFACTIFGVVGALLSSQMPNKQTKVLWQWQNEVAISLAIVFGYYIVSITGATLSQLGIIIPFLGAWMPNFVGILVLLALLFLIRRKESRLE